jgi:hypothetical protein
MKKVLSIVLFGLMAFLPQSPAETTVIGINLNTAGPGPFDSYTVPGGKTLLIENMSAYGASNTPSTPRIIIEIGLQVQNGGITTMRFGYPISDKYEAVSLKPPLRVEAGRDVRILNNSTLAYNVVRIQGLLVDNTDLYAQTLDLELTPIGVQEGRFIAEATVSSPRPALVETETSTDLMTFEDNVSEETSRQADPTKWTVSTDADSDKKFLTATATGRESQ